MTTYLKRYIALLMLCGTLSQCEMLGIKPKNELPPETQEGKNTFGCLVNGEVWTPFGRIGLTSSLQPEYGSNGYFALSGYRVVEGKTRGLGFSAFGVYKEGVYKIVGLDDTTNPNQQGSTGYTDENLCRYGIYQKNILAGTVQVTKFQRQSDGGLIIAGKFSYSLTSPYPQQCKDTIKITEGRFDILFH